MSECNKFSQDAGGTECNYGPLCSSWWSCHTLIISVLLRLWPDASRTSPGSHQGKTSKNLKKKNMFITPWREFLVSLIKCQWNRRTTLWDHSSLEAADDWIIMKMRQLSCSYGVKKKNTNGSWLFNVPVKSRSRGCCAEMVLFHLSAVRGVYGGA